MRLSIKIISHRRQKWGDDFVIFPVDGYGNAEMIRSVMRQQRPDMLWFMTDPRFFTWLWDIEDEVRTLCPMIYYHVWDNYPAPKFNSKYYNSTDVIACISKLTYDIVQKVSPEVESHYLPHAVDSEIFKKLDDEAVKNFKEAHLSKVGKKVIGSCFSGIIEMHVENKAEVSYFGLRTF